MSLFLFANVGSDESDTFDLDVLIVPLSREVQLSLKKQARLFEAAGDGHPNLAAMEYLNYDFDFYDTLARRELPAGVLEGLSNSGWELCRDPSFQNWLDQRDACRVESRCLRWQRTYESTHPTAEDCDLVWSACPKHTTVRVYNVPISWPKLLEHLESS